MPSTRPPDPPAVPPVVLPRRASVSRTVANSLAAIACAAALGGCAASGQNSDVPFSLTEDYASGTVSYTVQPGDALANIALEFTGDMSTWQTIAVHNGIEDPRRLAAGQVLEIPGNLIPRQARPDNRQESAAATRTTASDAAAMAEVQQPALPDTRVPVVVSAVESNRQFDLAPMDETSGFDAGRYIKVVGTYFPIALYSEPSSASRLVMRVAPGTLFPLEREIGDWLKVDTDQGPAFLRSSDGDVVSRQERSASLTD